MSTNAAKVIPFPQRRCRGTAVCPHCGTLSGQWRLGRLLWGYCDDHELRWVVADFPDTRGAAANPSAMREGLERLSAFVEVTR